MNSILYRWCRRRKSRIERRLDKSKDGMAFKPALDATNMHYEASLRTGAIACGGIGAVHLLAKELGLPEELDARLGVLKLHMPYYDSDHVLAIAYNALCGGTCLEDLERLRTDEHFLDALGTKRLPDPTTAGDFCRRFGEPEIYALINAVNAVRLRAWAGQPDAFFDRATVDADGSLVPTAGECKAGMGIAYDGTWGYHPLALTLAETGEVLSIVNRPGNRPSHEGASREFDRALLLLSEAGFRRIVFRGDTDFSQCERLDGWDANSKVRFYFGFDAKANLKGMAMDLPESAWRKLERPARSAAETQPRQRPANVKERIVEERGYENVKLISEDVAEFDYQPGACRKAYRMVVVRKNLSVEKGKAVLFEDHRYFFYITNDRESPAAEVVSEANGRCNQENVIAQLKGGCRALHAPVNTLHANWAYMLMAALAWNLKAWYALALPADPGRWQEKHREENRKVLRMEFRTFVNAFVMLPCQILKKGRRIIYRLLGWNRHVPVFLRLLKVLKC